MKKLMLFAVISVFLLTSVMNARNPLEAFFEKYSEIDGSTYANVTPGPDMKQSFNFQNNDMSSVIKGIETIKVLRYKQEQKDAKGSSSFEIAKKIYADALKSIPKKGYEKFLEVKEKNKKIKMFTKNSKGKIREIILLIYEADESTVIWLKGEIDLSQLSNISNVLKIYTSSGKKGKE